MAETKQLDADLTNGLKLAKSQRVFFALVLKGGADGALVVSKAKITPKAIAAAQKQCGGKAVIKGACFFEEGKYVFEVAKAPPATAKAVLKLIAKRDAGLGIDPIVRLGTNADLADDDDVKAAPEVAETPLGGMGQFKERLQQVKPKLDALKATDAPRHLDLTKRLVAAMGSAQAKDFPTALTGLDEIEAALGSPTKTTPPPSPDGMTQFKAKTQTLKPRLDTLKATDPTRHAELSKSLLAALGSAQAKDFPTALARLDEIEAGLTSPPKAPPAPPPDGMTQFKGRLQQVKPKLDALKATDPTRFAELSKRLVAAMGSAQAKDFPKALGVLDEIETALKSPPAAPPKAPPPEGMAQFKGRLQQVKPGLDALKTTDPTRFAELSKRLVAAMGSAQAKDFPAALTTLDEIEAALKSAPPSPETTTGEKPDEKLAAVFARARVTWEKAIKGARGQLQELTDVILNDSQDDPRSDEIDTLVQKLATVLDPFDDRLPNKLEEAQKAVPEGKHQAALGEARKLVQEYRAYLENEQPVFKNLDHNPFKRTKVRKTIENSLKQVAEMLA